MSSPRFSSLCVFCASSSNVDPQYLDLARDVGALLAERDVHLVYGGAQGGLMGAAADGALAAGGEVTGVMPEIFIDRERAHNNLTTLHRTKDMHTRQTLMAELSDGFIVLPGGLGTLAEFFEILTWKVIGLHDKPIILVNAFGFWDSMIAQLDACSERGFLHESKDTVFQTCETVGQLDTFLSSE